MILLHVSTVSINEEEEEKEEEQENENKTHVLLWYAMQEFQMKYDGLSHN